MRHHIASLEKVKVRGALTPLEAMIPYLRQQIWRIHIETNIMRYHMATLDKVKVKGAFIALETETP